MLLILQSPVTFQNGAHHNSHENFGHDITVSCTRALLILSQQIQKQEMNVLPLSKKKKIIIITIKTLANSAGKC